MTNLLGEWWTGYYGVSRAVLFFPLNNWEPEKCTRTFGSRSMGRIDSLSLYTITVFYYYDTPYTIYTYMCDVAIWCLYGIWLSSFISMVLHGDDSESYIDDSYVHQSVLLCTHTVVRIIIQPHNMLGNVNFSFSVERDWESDESRGTKRPTWYWPPNSKILALRVRRQSSTREKKEYRERCSRSLYVQSIYIYI